MKTTKKLDVIAQEYDEEITDFTAFKKGFDRCLEELDDYIKSFEDDWSRNPQEELKIFKSKYIK